MATKTKQEGGGNMSEKERQIFETFAFIIPRISESDKSYLLGLGEGVKFKIEQEEHDSERAE